MSTKIPGSEPPRQSAGDLAISDAIRAGAVPYDLNVTPALLLAELAIRRAMDEHGMTWEQRVRWFLEGARLHITANAQDLTPPAAEAATDAARVLKSIHRMFLRPPGEDPKSSGLGDAHFLRMRKRLAAAVRALVAHRPGQRPRRETLALLRCREEIAWEWVREDETSDEEANPSDRAIARRVLDNATVDLEYRDLDTFRLDPAEAPAYKRTLDRWELVVRRIRKHFNYDERRRRRSRVEFSLRIAEAILAAILLAQGVKGTDPFAALRQAERRRREKGGA